MNKEAKKAIASPEDKARANQAVQNYDYLLKLDKVKEKELLAKLEEKAYNRKFWRTAKEVTNGTFGKTINKSHIR